MEIIYNENNLKENEINNEIKRAKIIFENSKGEIILAFSSNNYYLIGGHVENSESYNDCLIREILEETGVNVNVQVEDPFLVIKYYTKDYPEKGKNTKYTNAYFATKLDLIPDLVNMNLTEGEKENHFELRFITKEIILDELEKSLECATRVNVVKDTINALKTYLNEEN